jgi:hypothetical protein
MQLHYRHPSPALCTTHLFNQQLAGQVELRSLKLPLHIPPFSLHGVKMRRKEQQNIGNLPESLLRASLMLCSSFMSLSTVATTDINVCTARALSVKCLPC